MTRNSMAGGIRTVVAADNISYGTIADNRSTVPTHGYEISVHPRGPLVRMIARGGEGQLYSLLDVIAGVEAI